MKNFFNMSSDGTKAKNKAPKSRSGAHSISMEFEDNLLESSRAMSSFSDTWVNKELERSKLYFYEKIKEA